MRKESVLEFISATSRSRTEKRLLLLKLHDLDLKDRCSPFYSYRDINFIIWDQHGISSAFKPAINFTVNLINYYVFTLVHYFQNEGIVRHPLAWKIYFYQILKSRNNRKNIRFYPFQAGI